MFHTWEYTRGEPRIRPCIHPIYSGDLEDRPTTWPAHYSNCQKYIPFPVKEAIILSANIGDM